MVYIVSTIDEKSSGAKETFVGQFDTMDKVEEMVKAAGKFERTNSYGIVSVRWTSPEYRIREMANGTPPVTTTNYSVASQTDWNKTYVVTVEDNSGKILTCSCPDHEHRKNFCKHMRQVKNFGTRGLKVIPKTLTTPTTSSKSVPYTQTTPSVPDAPYYQWVRSETDWRKSYKVGIAADSRTPISCTCPSFEHRQQACKHMRSVENFRSANYYPSLVR